MPNEDLNKMKQEMEDWADKKLNEVLEVERFKNLGLENDFVSQALVFMGRASQQLSLGKTVLTNDEIAHEAFKARFQALQAELHNLQSDLRTLK